MEKAWIYEESLIKSLNKQLEKMKKEGSVLKEKNPLFFHKKTLSSLPFEYQIENEEDDFKKKKSGKNIVSLRSFRFYGKKLKKSQKSVDYSNPLSIKKTNSFEIRNFNCVN